MEKCLATKIVEFDMAHRVPNHKSKCRNLHGHRYRVEATVEGPIAVDSGQSDAGMVMDFGDIKDILMTHVHDVYDHGAMFYVLDPVMQETMFRLKELDPGQNVNFVDFVPTAENIARHIYYTVQRELPSELSLRRIRVYETPNSWADYEGVGQ